MSCGAAGAACWAWGLSQGLAMAPEAEQLDSWIARATASAPVDLVPVSCVFVMGAWLLALMRSISVGHMDGLRGQEKLVKSGITCQAR